MIDLRGGRGDRRGGHSTVSWVCYGDLVLYVYMVKNTRDEKIFNSLSLSYRLTIRPTDTQLSLLFERDAFFPSDIFFSTMSERFF